MARKGGSDNNASFGGLTTRKGKIGQHTSVFSTATQSTIDAGASGTKSFSEGAISRHQKDVEVSTISSDGIHLTRESSIRRVVSLEPVLPLNKEIVSPVAGKVEQDQIVDDIQSSFKAPYTDKHLMSESSSSNSSHVIAPHHSDNKSQLELRVETKPGREALKCSLLVNKKSRETVRSTSKKGELSKGIVKQLKSCDEQATSETSQLSSEKMKTAEIASPKTWHGFKEAAHEEQLSKLRVTSGQVPRVSEFDLNEDLEINEVASAKNSLESVSYRQSANALEPIAVVAKVGIPSGLPSTPLRFDGERGWRKSVATSAFRATFPSNNSDLNKGSNGKSTDSNSTTLLGDRGFDLNFAPPSENHAVESSVELSLKVSEGDKYHARQNSKMLSFDLNDNLLMDKDTGSGLHPPGLNNQPKRHYPSTDIMNGNARQGNVSGVRPAYWVDLSSMPGFTHVQGQPFLVAAPNLFPSADQKQTLFPLQPNMAFTPGPPSGYYIGATNGLSSSIYPPNILPHFGSQHGTSPTLPQLSGPVLTPYPGSLHLMENAQGLNPGGYTNMRPSFFLSNGVGSSENGNRFGNIPAEERMRLSHSQAVALPALADKRKEPEGSWGSYQLDHRRMTTWK